MVQWIIVLSFGFGFTASAWAQPVCAPYFVGPSPLEDKDYGDSFQHILENKVLQFRNLAVARPRAAVATVLQALVWSIAKKVGPGRPTFHIDGELQVTLGRLRDGGEIEFLHLLSDCAREFRKDPSPVDPDVRDAVLVEFINFVAMGFVVDFTIRLGDLIEF